MAKKNISAQETARLIRERKNRVKAAAAAKKKPAKKKATYLKKSQTNASIKKGKDALKNLSRAQIEKLRAKLSKQRKAKKAKK